LILSGPKLHLYQTTLKKVTPKKHLGQHFLKDEGIALDIVNAISEDPGSLLEIGAGTGVLTKYLLNSKNPFLAFDVDPVSIDFLKLKYPQGAHKFYLRDFLSEDLSQYEAPLRLIGNFPYNISSQIFFQIYDNRLIVDEVVCMVQKEVAQRIVSIHGNKVYGILSVLLQAFYNIEYLFTVGPQVFDPPPKVDSAVIRLTRNDRADFETKTFKRVVKAGFGKRRKTLRNALKELNLRADFTENDFFNLRAEQLSIQDFIDLTVKIEKEWKK